MPNLGSGNLLVMIRGAFGNSYKGSQLASEVIFILGSASVAVMSGLEPVAWCRTQQDFPGKNTGVGCRALLQGIFLTQGSNLCLLYLLRWQTGSLPLEPPGKTHHSQPPRNLVPDPLFYRNYCQQFLIFEPEKITP